MTGNESCCSASPSSFTLEVSFISTGWSLCGVVGSVSGCGSITEKQSTTWLKSKHGSRCGAREVLTHVSPRIIIYISADLCHITRRPWASKTIIIKEKKKRTPPAESPDLAFPTEGRDSTLRLWTWKFKVKRNSCLNTVRGKVGYREWGQLFGLTDGWRSVF